MAHKCTKCRLGVYRPRYNRKREPRHYCDRCGHRYMTLDEHRDAIMEGMKPYLTARAKQVDDEVTAAMIRNG